MSNSLKRQSIWYLVILVVGSIFFLVNYSFRDAVFFWILIGISYQIKLTTINISGLFALLQFFTKLIVILTKTNLEEIMESAEKVYGNDSDSMDASEFTNYYETLGLMTNAKIWYESVGGEDLREERPSTWKGWPSKISVRNIISRWLGYNDPKVAEYIRKISKNNE